ncbi:MULTISPECIES: hypothetical protein [unclassified Amycolatopsis]|uniref:hypothetical protein n=1 Tax=unclassified Amycolatopsis TaxID=2618356 RepID=UPI002E1C8A30|nr:MULTISPECIES: hypothetical protein [unclassified Amycolatopsis]
MREHVLWTGKPVNRPIFHRYDHTMAVLVLGTLIGVTTWFGRADQTPADRATTLAATIAFGALVFLEPAARIVRLRRTTYAITDHRVTATGGLLGPVVRTVYLADLEPPVVHPERNGTGTISFGELEPYLLAHARFGHRVKRRHLPLVLAGIAEPAEVRDLLVQAIGEARQRRASGDHDTSLF